LVSINKKIIDLQPLQVDDDESILEKGTYLCDRTNFLENPQEESSTQTQIQIPPKNNLK